MKKRSLYTISLLLFFPGIVLAQNDIQPVVSRVKCQGDTTQEYAFYRPVKFNALLIFLDPVARGNVPVEKYHTLADEFGCIIAGSYNSRNFDANSSVRSFVAIYNDITSRYSIDPNKIWLAGFSGAARAASAIAAIYPEIKGVIGCGAGFASEEINTTKLNNYAAIAGTGDMNFTELLDNCNYLDEKKVNNLLLTFYGGHEWPPAETFGLAIEWLADNTIEIAPATKRGSFFIGSVQQEFDAGFLYSALFNAIQLSKIRAYKAVADSLKNKIRLNKEFRTDSIAFMQAVLEEQNCMNEFSVVFNNAIYKNVRKDSDGEKLSDDDWMEKAKAIDQMKKNSGYLQMSAVRCFDHCTRICQEYYFKLFGEADYNLAYKAARILSFFTPGDPESYYLMARTKAALNDKKQCVEMLKEAVKRGLVFSKRIVQSLQPVLSNDEVEKIFGKN